MSISAILLWAFAAAGTDATSAWEAAGRPLNGVHDAGEWVLSCICEPTEPDEAGFSDVDLAACKQETIVALVERFVGRPTIPAAVPESLRPLVASTLSDWHLARVSAGGLTWVQSGRSQTSNLVVLAVPAAVCKAMPKGNEWVLSLSDVAASAKGWIAPAALLEASDDQSRERVKAIVIARLAESVEPPADHWPSGFVKLPEGAPPELLAKLSLPDLATIAATRPGDVHIWNQLAKKCEAVQLKQAADLVRGLGRLLKWGKPAPAGAKFPWSAVAVGDLPGPLVSVIRAGGAIPCLASPPADASRAALVAFSAKVPDPIQAELKAREAADRSDPDALNILAALRLSDPKADDDSVRQALAFAWQCQLLVPDHPYAKVNVLRAMRRLGMRDEVIAFLKSVPNAESGTWADRELTSIAKWLDRKESQDDAK